SGRRLSCVATATAASSSICCPPLPFIPPLFSPPSSPSPPSPPPPPPSAPLMALCRPLFTIEETPFCG
ncbi:Dynein heavy chain 1, axonemal, partial [Larimichthys crocea]